MICRNSSKVKCGRYGMVVGWWWLLERVVKIWLCLGNES